jgi:hypothetical protein
MQQQAMRLGRRIGIAVAGGTVTAAGVAGLALPVMPGMVLIVVGLGILSLEFEKPRIWLAHLKARGVQVKDRILRKKPGSGED